MSQFDTKTKAPSSQLTLSAPKQKEGGKYERLALAYLQAQGLILVAQNWLAPKIGELDLVMIHKGRAWDTLVFIEVRKRKKGQYGDALASITTSKQRKIINTARRFLYCHPQYQNHDCRFDIVAYTDCNLSQLLEPQLLEPEWIAGAFIVN